MDRRNFFKRTVQTVAVTPFIPITERLLDYKPGEAKTPVEVTPITLVRGPWTEALKPGLKEELQKIFHDSYYPGQIIMVKR